jgi:multidrug efflux pump subunit AcrA (membrane-fusion protein)
MLRPVRFRTKALAKRRQAEELDRLPEVAKPRGWLAALALAVVVGGLVAYAVAGEIPRRVEADGVLASRGGIIEVQSRAAGEVQEMLVEIGDEVAPDTPIARVENAAGEEEEVLAGSHGKVLELRTATGRVLEPGSEVITIAGEPGEKPTGAYLFVDQDDAAEVAPGMQVDVDVSTAPSQDYGVVRGEIESVSGTPISPQEMDVLLSNDGLVKQFSESGPPILATVALHRADTPSGLAWSTGDGPESALVPGTIVAADVQQGEQPVLDVIFGDR